jgi:pimeloyl-ACP methyl ester carboxylesterase
MTEPARKKPAAGAIRHLRASDMRGVAKLATESIVGINRITEAVHQAVLAALGLPGAKAPGRTRGITGLVYQSIDAITRLVAKGIDAPLAALQPLFDVLESERPETPGREVAVAILNGVMGDRLAATANPLAITMTLRSAGKALDRPSMRKLAHATDRPMVLIHGLCMSDVHWRPAPRLDEQDAAVVVDHGQALAAAGGFAPICLRYNSGLHTSLNGHELARLLEQLVEDWPTPIEQLTLVGFSMGGLLVRSACHYGAQAGMRWPGLLKNAVFLATPHHGAPLERAGNWLDVVLGSTSFSAPYGKLIQLRSAGITDLRYGHVLDDDWLGRDRFRRTPDRRQHVPLPAGVNCFALAASTASRRSPLADRLVGDGLVPVLSALGQHDDAGRTLGFAKARQTVVYGMHHMEVPTRPEVTRQLLEWLVPAAAGVNA